VHPSLEWVDASSVTPAPQVGWSYADGAFAGPPAPTLAEARAAQIALLRDACAAEIVGGYSSSALGTPHLYPSTPTDQANMAASVLASLLPDLAAGWTTPFWCADADGAWSFAPHTAAQIQQAGIDGKAMVVAAQTRLAGLEASIAAASTVAAVQAVVW
jgi:hypothetical protein